MTNSTPEITTDSLIAILDTMQFEYTTLLDQLDLDTPAEGEWNPRQVLSHVIGALYRSPIQAGFFLAGATRVPVIFHDPYWITEWDGAPIASFKAGLRAAIEGNKALVRSLAPDDLARSIYMGDWGEMSLGAFLVTSYQAHVNGQHIPQIKAFLTQTINA